MTFDSLKALECAAGFSEVSGEVFAQIMHVRQKSTRGNKPYLEVSIGDAESNSQFKVWDNAPWYADCLALPIGDVYALSARWRMGEYGMEVSDLTFRSLSSDEEEVFWRGSPALCEKQTKDRMDIQELCKSMQDARLRALCLLFLERFGVLFERAAAARNYHHARRGGLTEHTAGMMRCATQICTAYPHLNRDLLLAGCLFHDCGKLWENNYGEHDFLMPYAEVGEMLGHITIGIEIVNKLWHELAPSFKEQSNIQPPADQVRLHLLHLIAAHHGELQFGSPVPPKTPEAFALHCIDNLDAKLEMFRDVCETGIELAPRIRQRKPPLPGNVILPLPTAHAQE